MERPKLELVSKGEGTTPKAILATVGVGSGAAGEVPSVLKTLKKTLLGEDYVCISLVVSAESARLEKYLRADLRSEDYFVFLTQNPDDLEECFKTSSEALYEISSRGYPPSSTAVDATSGTAAMRIGAVMAGVVLGVSRYRLIVGPREQGLVRTETAQFKYFDPSFFLAEEDLRLAYELVRANRFGAALTVLERRRKQRDSPAERRARWLRDVAMFYLKWDYFDHAGARALLEAALPLKGSSEPFDDLAPTEANQEQLRVLAASPPRSVLAADLLANAERRALESRFDDAVGRLYRCMELVAEEELARKGLDRYSLSSWGNAAKGTGVESVGDGSPAGLVRMLSALEGVGSPIGLLASDKEFRAALDRRNESILAHGNSPMSKDDYVKMGNFVRRCAQLVWSDFSELVPRSHFRWQRTRAVVGR